MKCGLAVGWVLRVAWLLAVCQCSAEPPVVPEDAGPDASSCSGVTPSCATWYGSCCDDVFFQATCRGGAWECDPCVLGEWACTRPVSLFSECSRGTRDLPPMGMSLDEYCGLADGG